MVMSQIKKVESEKKENGAEEGGGTPKKKRSIIIIPVISLKSGQEGRNLAREDVLKIRMLFMGRIVMEKVVPLEEIVDEIGQVVVRGKILKMELREIRRERTIVSFHITDFTGHDRWKDIYCQQPAPGIFRFI